MKTTINLKDSKLNLYDDYDLWKENGFVREYEIDSLEDITVDFQKADYCAFPEVKENIEIYCSGVVSYGV